jgi:hypothetical protein
MLREYRCTGAGAGFQQWVFKFDNLLPKKKSKIIEFSDYLLFGRLFILLLTYMLLFSKRRILELIRREVFFTKGLFGSQPHFAKLNFGCHSFVGRCLVLATLWRVIFYFSYDPLVIELLFLPILAKVWLQIFYPHFL